MDALCYPKIAWRQGKKGEKQEVVLTRIDVATDKRDIFIYLMERIGVIADFGSEIVNFTYRNFELL